MDKKVTICEKIAGPMFKNKYEEGNAFLKEYCKGIYLVTLSYSISSKMTFKAAVVFLMDNLPPLAKSCECIRCYVDDETHEVTCIFHKKRTLRERFEELNRDFNMGKEEMGHDK